MLLLRCRTCQALHEEGKSGPQAPPIAQAQVFLSLVMSNQNEKETWTEIWFCALVHRLVVFYTLRRYFRDNPSSTRARELCLHAHKALRDTVTVILLPTQYFPEDIERFLRYLDMELPDSSGPVEHTYENGRILDAEGV
jgi:hypothetical protein